MSILKDLCYLGLTLCSIYAFYHIIKVVVFPNILNLFTKVKETNPDWLAGKLRSQYYGFNDIDFIICECPIYNAPRFRLTKDMSRIQFLVPTGMTVWDREKLAKIALIGKIKIRYDVDTSFNKPIEWLSILCYMLDGGDINISETKWVENKNS